MEPVRRSPRRVAMAGVALAAAAAALVSPAVAQAEISPAACANPGQVLVNPGFESGQTGWDGANWSIHTWTGTAAPRSGSRSAWLGGTAAPTVESLRQTVTIPAGCVNSTLSVHVKIDTAETLPVAYDTLTVRVGTTTVGRFSNVDKGDYRLRSFNVGAFAGQTVTVSFISREDWDVQTSFILDDLALTTG
ncbi:hypothetical protein F4560_001222 [Saccharothrix ecbatanensis]|uniref:Carbohydrate binding protein n=1 Tax=Saccharothrix ecbatanensis TaxID=1105145 RepID=A0A7W9HFS4_9PSEU|nr:hypothetical protein [Saccharothrix ecbatanensis]MBB5801454.1 hypothetical protein [Saccharothrix ecbatanensis]